MRPQPFARIDGQKYLVSKKGAVSIRLMMNNHFSSGKSSIGETCWIPALLTRMSQRPKDSSTRSARARHPAALLRSALMKVPPRVVAARLPASSLMSTRTTWAPFFASVPAIARPIPLAAPVTTAMRSVVGLDMMMASPLALLITLSGCRIYGKGRRFFP